MALIFDTSLDINGKPVKPVEVDQSFNPTSTNAQSGVAVKEAIDQAVEGIYKPAGSLLFANLPNPSADILGFVYNVTDAFTTDARFVEGVGTECAAGTNVVVVNTGTAQNPVYMFDILAAGAVQVQSDWTQTDTSAVDYIKNKPTIPTYTAGTGIDITNNTISVTSPVLTNTATGLQSLSINTVASSEAQTVGVGYAARNFGRQSVAVGCAAIANEGAVAIGRYSNAYLNSIAIGNLAQTSGEGTIQIGGFANGMGVSYDDNKMFVGSTGVDNWELLDRTTGKIPDARLSTNVQTKSNLVTSVSSSSTDTQYPSAKLLYDTVGNIETLINAL